MSAARESARPLQTGDRVQPRPGTSDGAEGPGTVGGTEPTSWTPGDYMVHVRHDNGTVTSWDSSDLERIDPEPSSVDEYECPVDGCTFHILAAGPLDPDEPDHFAEEIDAHQRSHVDDGRIHDVAEAERLAHVEDAERAAWAGYESIRDGITRRNAARLASGPSIIRRVLDEVAKREPEGEPADLGEDDDVPEPIVITRERNYPVVARPGPAWRWSYQYTVNGEECQYGTGLASLRDLLKRKFPGVPVVLAWEASDAPALVQLDRDDAAARVLNAAMEWEALRSSKKFGTFDDLADAAQRLAIATSDYRESIGGAS